VRLFRREPFRFLCPYCGGIFFAIHVSMERYPDQVPRLSSIRGDITCDRCGLVTDYDDFIRMHRGWLVPRRETAQHGRSR
jgi:ribosomal protein S27AE